MHKKIKENSNHQYSYIKTKQEAIWNEIIKDSSSNKSITQ